MTLAVEHRAPTHSFLSRWDARWKLAGILLTTLVIAAFQEWSSALAAFGLALLLAWLGKLPARWMWSRLGLLSIGLIPFLVILPLTLGGEGWQLGNPLARDAAGRSWVVSFQGIETAVLLTFKALAIGVVMLILLASAPLPETLAAAHHLRIPGVMVQMTLLCYRYVFLLAGEFARIRTALRVRGFRSGLNRHTYQTVGRVMGTLLVRGHHRAEHVAQAMACRGFDGHFRSLAHYHTKLRDVFLFAILIISVTGLLTWDIVARR